MLLMHFQSPERQIIKKVRPGAGPKRHEYLTGELHWPEKVVGRYSALIHKKALSTLGGFSLGHKVGRLAQRYTGTASTSASRQSTSTRLSRATRF
jgi:hypothetical protein